MSRRGKECFGTLENCHHPCPAGPVVCRWRRSETATGMNSFIYVKAVTGGARVTPDPAIDPAEGEILGTPTCDVSTGASLTILTAFIRYPGNRDAASTDVTSDGNQQLSYTVRVAVLRSHRCALPTRHATARHAQKPSRASATAHERIAHAQDGTVPRKACRAVGSRLQFNSLTGGLFHSLSREYLSTQ